MLPLTPVQQKVYDLDQKQIRPIKIAELTGLRLSRVANIKSQLKRLGYSVTLWRSSNVPGRPMKSPERNNKGGGRHVRSFCICGLTLPCNNCLDQLELGADGADRDGGLAIWERGKVYTG